MLGLNKRLLLILLLGAIVTLSCAARTFIVNVSYGGDLPESTGLKSIPPIAFVVNRFEDDRPYIDRVAQVSDGMITDAFNTSIDVRNITQDAIVHELQRNGHKAYTLVTPENAEIIIDGTLKEFWVEIKSAFWIAEIEASIRANVVVKNAQTSEIMMSKTFTGTHSTGGLLGWPGKSMKQFCEIGLNEALKEFMINLTTDNEFLEACKKVSH